MSEQSPKPYLFLIQELLRCPSGMEKSILDATSDLIDDGLVSMIQQMKQTYGEMRDQDTVDALNRLLQLVSERLEITTMTETPLTSSDTVVSRNYTATSTSTDTATPSSIPETDETVFIQEILPLILQGDGDLEKTMQLIFQSSLGQLDPASAQQLLSSVLGSGGNSQQFINLLLQSGFLGQMDSASTEIIQTLMNNVSQRGKANSLQKNLVLTIEEMLQLAEKRGNAQGAEALKYPLQELAKLWGVSLSNNVVESQVVESQNTLIQIIFLKIVQTKEQGKSYEQIYSEVSPLLEGNIDKLNDDLPHLLEAWARTLPKGTPEQAKQFAAVIFLMGESIAKFPLGSVATNIEIAISCYEVALKFFIREDDPELWASVQGSLGNAYLDRIREDKAENIEKAITAHQAALQSFSLANSRKEWVSTQIHLSNAYRVRIQGNKVTNIEVAVTAAEAALKQINRGEFPQVWAKGKETLANAYSDRIEGNRAENVELAIAAYEEALEVYTQESNPEGWAGIHNNLAYAYRKRSQGNRDENLEQAIEACKKAISVQSRKKNPPTWATVQTTLGTIYLERIQGDRAENLRLAITAYRAALEVYTPEAFPEQWAMIQSNLAVVYFYSADRFTKNSETNLESAIEAGEAALQVYTREAFPEKWAMICTTLANAYSRRIQGDKTENIEQAIATYKKALEVSTRETLPHSWALIQLCLAIAYQDRIQGNKTKNLQLAIAACHAALEIYTPETFPSLWAMTQNNLGTIHLELGEIEAAIKSYQLALEIHTPKTNPVDCFKHGHNLGRAALQLGQLQEAIAGLSTAIEAVEQSRAWTTLDLRKQELLSDAINVYFGIVEAYVQDNQPDRAIEYVERSKARNLVELLATRDLSPKGVPESVSERFKQLRQEMVTQRRRLEIVEERLGFLNIGDGERIDNLETRPSERQYLNQLEEQLDDLMKTIDQIDPTFRETQQVKAIPFNQIVSAIDAGTAIVEWYLTSNSCYTFIITSDCHQPQVLSSAAIDNKIIQDLNNWFYEYFEDYQNDKNHWRSQLTERLQQLSQLLHIEDILTCVPTTCDRIILIPHRFLHLLPLHALPLNDGTSLFERFLGGVSYAPSCQMLQQLQKRQRPNFESIFAIQNPTEDLGYTDTEVEIIKSYFRQTNILKKANATKSAIEGTDLNTFHCAHFSCHGYFNLTNPRNSALMLADPSAKSTFTEPDSENSSSLQDDEVLDLEKYLTLDTIFTLNLEQCRLVTMSACETGLIDFNNTSDEYIGLPSAFLYAGTQYVVSSLWTVKDLSTAFLMAKFYENLQGQTSVAVALNQAQCWLKGVTKAQLVAWMTENPFPLNPTMRTPLQRLLHKLQDDDQPFQNPFHWAAFCAIGK
ncbi:CHAT domain-containing protein [Aetokthonos hydrillicola Thurmond2011]|jgi:CHAT domain-containing protein|uniref:CHAT domain-containing protein n=1 Tax=Aetokthonos hydrillicola Thurmond2011 TaxID=2712845 RepID=A0AAP5I1C2_9CYAN|nr:CHAT domain-containing protein [Aetokthonos hydrillicola]MBO3460167.1 CHAT domain-containing protein [Aetokthonos hydrillicola CCALA 1050]MBW4590567.1 CHAT domain-containing protein [Aetokthonos hydrillicola CCALA 1050]MDR9893024.1 CHAT domain-containing protein [Aetokthonos hydrillicola Thurmond2011]